MQASAAELVLLRQLSTDERREVVASIVIAAFPFVAALLSGGLFLAGLLAVPNAGTILPGLIAAASTSVTVLPVTRCMDCIERMRLLQYLERRLTAQPSDEVAIKTLNDFLQRKLAS